MDGIQKGKKQSMELIMGKSLSIFKLGTNISNYLFLKHLFYPKNENIVYDYDVYEFVELNVDLYVRTDGIVDCITTHSSCVYMGRELINMYYDIYLDYCLIRLFLFFLKVPKKMGVIIMYITLIKE